MKSVYLLIASILLSFTLCNAQIKNAKTATVKIYGNCEMCEKTIEKAGNSKKIAQVDWNKDTKMASLTYDSTQTNQNEILKRIALSGYDSDQFLAPDNAYLALPGCCQYVRANKTTMAKEAPKMEMENHEKHTHGTTHGQQENQLKAIFDDYFAIKEALVKSDGNTASAQAKNLFEAIAEVNMGALSVEEHLVFMKEMQDLSVAAKHISETKDISHQRAYFSTLSDNVYQLIKVSKQETPVYYQYCPMYNDGKGANWLSKETAIKNPYYGSQMLTCGKTTETIK